MFIIKNSYISHCGKKPPPAHCAGGRADLKICGFQIETLKNGISIFLQIDHLTKFFLALILVLGQKNFQGSLYIPRSYFMLSL